MVGFIACVALVFSILCFYKIHTLKKDKAKEDRGKSRETEEFRISLIKDVKEIIQ